MTPGKIVLVTGGACSGKSEVAEQLAAAFPGRVTYLATAGVYDDEMARRVLKHRKRRPAGWVTVEETQQLARALLQVPRGSCVLVDCLTLWITNLLLDESSLSPGVTAVDKEEYILNEVVRVLEVARNRGLALILVSNQVGCGIVPENQLSRYFRDIAGRVNQRVAALADQVYLVTAGIPVELKSLAVKVGWEDI